MPASTTAYDSDIAPPAALMADPTRAVMLHALLEGRPLAAGELARLAGVTAATASSHLARLLEGRLVTVTRQGRHRYYQLAGYEVAAALEALAHISPNVPIRTLRQSKEAEALAEARTCYDHLAGKAGVALLDALLSQGTLREENPAGGSGPWGPGACPRGSAVSPRVGTAISRTDSGDSNFPGHDSAVAAEAAVPASAAYQVTDEGTATMASFGINVAEIHRSRRHFAGACLDWTQRRSHLNGALGAAITTRLFDLGWIERGPRRRSVRVTEAGREGLAATFGWTDAA
jgi:DNA-binding transcriptional ArsR family regulator